jgi:hypothetical protein
MFVSEYKPHQQHKPPVAVLQFHRVPSAMLETSIYINSTARVIINDMHSTTTSQAAGLPRV